MLVSHVGIESDIGPLWNYISKHFPVWDLDSLEETIIAKNELEDQTWKNQNFLSVQIQGMIQ